MFKLATLIGSKTEEPFDLKTVQLGALLHDVADHKFGHTDQDLRDRLIQCCKAIGWDDVDTIYKIVTNVSFSKGGKPVSIEGKIVQDADRIDAIGAIGIARCFAYGGGAKRSIAEGIQHFDDKLFKLKDLLNTQPAKLLAEERHKYMKQFIEKINNEMNGLE